MLPFVSVLCPTYNRNKLLPILVQQYRMQDYPARRRELIILDDSVNESKVLENVENSIKYVHVKERMTIGEKRNWLLSRSRGEIIVWMDDDDLYRSDRISKSVKVLTSEPVDIIGVKSTVFYDVNSRRFCVVNHKSENYTCNNILAHRKNLGSRYRDEDAIGEEKHFTDYFKLKAYRFDGVDLCIHMCHERNTAGKGHFFRTLPQSIDLNKMKAKFDWGLLKKIECILKTVKNMNKIFWINLEKDVERRNFMVNELNKIDDKFKSFRFEALSSSTLNTDGYICSEDSLQKSSPEEICCMSSHVDLIKFASCNTKDDVLFIMEDDVNINKESFERLHDFIRSAPSDWEILQLHHVRLDCRRKKLQYDDIINGSWVAWKKGFYSTGFYAIKRSAVAKFLNTFYNYKAGKFDYQSVSGAIQADNVIYRHLRTYTALHNFVSVNVRFKSNIQKNNRNQLYKDFEAKFSSLFRL